MKVGIITPASAAYGSWQSPISAEVINQGVPARDFPCMIDGTVFWQESRPEENGRVTVVAHSPDGSDRDLLPYPFSTRSKVHEYGGKSWIVNDNKLYFVEQSDQQLYCLELGSSAQQPFVVAGDNTSRFADLVFDKRRKRIICVREQHLAGHPEPVNSIVCIDLDSVNSPSTLSEISTLAEISTLVSGADFYAYPRLDANGDKLCWISWDHPAMPWDGTELWCADVNTNGAPAQSKKIAGGISESIFQPAWSRDGTLYYVSDKNGWWNLYRHIGNENKPVIEKTADFATPLWVLGMCTWGFLDDSRIATLMSNNGIWQVGIIDIPSDTLTLVETPYTQLSSLSCGANCAVFIAANPRTACDVVLLGPDSQLATIKSSTNPDYADYVSTPQAISYASSDGDIAHGFYYPPHNPNYLGLEDEKPPLLVMCHGGPTAAASTALNYKIQFWTSRGFALLDVNYRGSTGFGRAYRQKLNGQWGISDVADAVAGIDFLAREGRIDRQRALIHGSSAGGYTTLAALTFTDAFRAGASLYGIGDLETLARDTHKFESRYMDTLVGPYPQRQDIYRQRSPACHPDKLRCPAIFFQGMEDKVVPPQQAENMVQALRDKHIPVAYISFADEGHGFRKAANIKKALEAELVFFRQILRISSEESLPAIAIENF
ncbi:MAG: hypothetical protein VR73_01460 [Gammaproteobacteria bacterium BRH_c0]|nr:MAG: hypothetical protein VR73_01460 [Gammaproteobacteria bacterium BRH_c0]